jgi:uncharacterized membrane protein YedE/YeeE
MSEFITPLLGGLLIGASASLLFVLLGRMAGVSGIFWNAINGIASFNLSENAWRICFVLGLILGPVLVHQFLGLAIPAAPSGGVVLAIVGGLIVGVGTRLGSGCTSGHGICGMARFSPRSIVATCTFMFFGFVCVYIARHVLGLGA